MVMDYWRYEVQYEGKCKLQRQDKVQDLPIPAENIGNMLYAIGTAIPKDTQYLMKTFDDSVIANEVPRIDNTTIYCTDENFDAIIKAISSRI